MNNVANYSAVKLDLKRNDYPYRNDDGTMHFTQGQSSILSEYNDLAEQSHEKDHLLSKLNYVTNEILAYSTIVDELAKDGATAIEKNNASIEELKDRITLQEEDIMQEEENLVDRGYVPDPDENSVEQPIEKAPKKTPNKRNWNAIASIVLTWMAGEAFLTITQYNSLRLQKSLNDLWGRSIAFGVTLILIHVVAHFNKNHKRLVHTIFLVFSFCMIMVMLLLPPVLNKIYPIQYDTTLAQQWSLSTSSSTSVQQTNYFPMWVQMYREYEMMPGVLCFMFFFIMQTLKGKPKPTSTPAAAPVVPTNLQPEFAEEKKRMLYKKMKLQKDKALLAESEARKINIPHASTQSLYNIYAKLNEKKATKLSIEQKITTITGKIEMRFKALLKELDNYKIEYKEALKNDPVKSNTINPIWATKNDILDHYNIKFI